MADIPTAIPEVSLLRLLSWLSPGFPVGAFGFSHGVEQAIHEGWVRDAPGLREWLADLARHGSVWNDAVLLAMTWRDVTAGHDIGWIAELALALSGSMERRRETLHLGAAFQRAVATGWPELAWPESSHALAYPVAVACAGARGGIDLRSVLVASVHASLANLISVAVRIVPLGQSDGVAVLADLESVMLSVAQAAALAGEDDLGSAAMMSEIMAMRHEELEPRIFIS